MNKQPTTSKWGALSRFFKDTFPAGLLTASVLLASGHTTQAGSATWQTNPGSGDWNTATNWMPNTVPNAPSDTATFGSSNKTNVTLSAPAIVSEIVFNPGASPFTISLASYLTIIGAGITNNSGLTQTFVTLDNGGGISFSNSSTAGDAFFPNGGVTFGGASTAGNATFVNDDSRDGLGSEQFQNSSTAGNATFTNNDGGSVVFVSNSSAGNAIITNKPGGSTTFNESQDGPANGGNATIINEGSSISGGGNGSTRFGHDSFAANATLVAKSGSNGGSGGKIFFTEYAKGGTARIQVFGNGLLNIALNFSRLGGVTVGSIEGDGQIFLGSEALTVGSNNLSTTFSGVIQDGGGITDARGGSLTKIGTGKLVLSHRNFYPGGTTVNRGRLLVNNIGGSGTGSGPVQVNRGKLGGKGMIAGTVTIGTGDGSGAVLAPGYLHGAGRPGALTIQSPLTFNSDGIYQMELDSSNVAADEVVANGVTINAGAQFSFLDFGSAALPPGTLFTAINNTAANAIAGAFVNLPDGSTFTNNGNTFKVNYKGGDGNDLTLTVVP